MKNKKLTPCLYLKELSINDNDDIFNMLKEIKSDENGFKNPVYGLDKKGFKKYLSDNVNMSNGVLSDINLVPQTTYWLYNKDYPVGVIRLRHWLNDALKVNGGNLGYCIRPDERNKGFGKIMLKLVIEKARAKGLKELLITTDYNNIYSRKMIESNNGVLEKTIDNLCYYRIQ